jgi:hypothetical protein
MPARCYEEDGFFQSGDVRRMEGRSASSGCGGRAPELAAISLEGGPPPAHEPVDEIPLDTLYFAQQAGQRHCTEIEPSADFCRASRHPMLMRV